MRIGLIFTRTDDLNEAISVDIDGRDDNDDVYEVRKALTELGHQVTNFYVDEKLYEQLKKQKEKIDFVFNMCSDGFYHNTKLEPHIPAMLDILGIPYTGGDYANLFLTTRKDLAKKMMIQNNFLTPKFQVFSKEKEELNNTLNYPLIVKPVREDGSIGIKEESVVYNENDLKRRIRVILRVYKQSAIVEEYIEGREFHVGVIGDKNREALPISEIIFEGLEDGMPKIINYEAKWVEDSDYYQSTKKICPANDVSKELSSELKNMSLRLGELFGCRDYYRVEFRLDKNGTPYIIELNPNPEISQRSELTLMAQADGYSHSELIQKIIQCTAKRIIKPKKVVVYLTAEQK